MDEQFTKYQQDLISLHEGDTWIWPESDYGLAEVHKINNKYKVFAIPTFGGEPYLHGVYDNAREVIEEVGGWT